MKNVLNCILLIIVAIIFFGCGGRTFGFDECEDNSECPINYICGQENRCIPFHQSSSSIIGDSDTTTDSETGTNQGTDSDSQTDTHTETDSESDSESDTSIDTAPICPYYCLDTLECIYIDGIFHLEFNCGSANSICCEPFVDTETGSDSETDSDSDSQSDSESDTDSATETDSNSDCPFDCMFYITCDSLGGVEESEYSCDGASNVCCNLTIDSDTQTDSETDSQSDGDCPFLCVSAWACGQSYSGTIAWDYSCDSFPNICCEPGTVIDTDSDSETDSTTDSDTHTDSDSATDSDTHTDSDSATDSD
ncbi:MAG: hypothetical protein JXX29_13970, partial [Deltaproteobacteria bacterium]|nr:hypothetical protein [Deltaproteobacteria bacterium]MBN2672784.1 hypothetical protein [Deltaproteobacteria bacterium]